MEWISNKKPYLSLDPVIKLVAKEKPNSSIPFRIALIKYREFSSNIVVVLERHLGEHDATHHCPPLCLCGWGYFSPNNMTSMWTQNRLSFPCCGKLQLVWCLSLLDKCSFFYGIYGLQMNQTCQFIEDCALWTTKTIGAIWTMEKSCIWLVRNT